MNIVEKKCPNCGANLEFKVGENDVKCPHCRRAFAIEYDKQIIDPEVQLKAKDIQLTLLKDFEQQRKFGKVFRTFVIIIFIVMFSFAMFMIIRGFIESEQFRTDFYQKREESRQEQEENNEVQKQMEERVLEMVDEQMEKSKSS